MPDRYAEYLGLSPETLHKLLSTAVVQFSTAAGA